MGRYIPSAKNRMVAEHYGKLGFAKAEASSDGQTLWRFDVRAFSAPDLPMRIEDTAVMAELVSD